MRTKISMLALMAVIALVTSSLLYGAKISAIQVKGKTIKIGDTADYVFSILTKDEMVSQEVHPDPHMPGSLVVTKKYKTDRKSFTIVLATVVYPGPYVVTKINLDYATSVRAGSKISIASFEASAFLKKHKPTTKDKWKIKSGEVYYHYIFADPENPYSGFGLHIGSDPTDLGKFTVEWHGESTLNPAKFTAPKETFLRDLLATIFPQVKTDAVISYVRKQRGKHYPGGGDAMPREAVGGVLVYSGTCGEGLIVGFEK